MKFSQEYKELTSSMTEYITKRQTTLIQCTSANLQATVCDVSKKRKMVEATILKAEWKSSIKSTVKIESCQIGHISGAS